MCIVSVDRPAGLPSRTSVKGTRSRHAFPRQDCFARPPIGCAHMTLHQAEFLHDGCTDIIAWSIRSGAMNMWAHDATRTSALPKLRPF